MDDDSPVIPLVKKYDYEIARKTTFSHFFFIIEKM